MMNFGIIENCFYSTDQKPNESMLLNLSEIRLEKDEY